MIKDGKRPSNDAISNRQRRPDASQPTSPEQKSSQTIFPRFLSAFGLIAGHFQPRRHRLSAREYRATLQGRFQTWGEITGVKLAG